MACADRVESAFVRDTTLGFVGFGSVGRHFAARLRSDYGRILRAHGVRPKVVGIATLRHGTAIDRRGLPLDRVLRSLDSGRDLRSFHRGAPVPSTRAFIDSVGAEVLFEISPLDPSRGEPATSHVRAALRRGMHVVTANKGPVAFAHGPLRALARRQKRAFLFEGAVLDGTPLFNLVDQTLVGCRLLGFRGVLNSTTTRILRAMEDGVSAEQALREAQAAGVVEADPRFDLDGWDAAVKGCAIANALMGARIRPAQVRREGIGAVSAEDVAAATAAGSRVRLVVRGRRAGRRVTVTVAPERLPIGDLLVSPGCDGVVVLETDLMREIGIWEGAGGVDQTAYALLSDLLAIVGGQR